MIKRLRSFDVFGRTFSLYAMKGKKTFTTATGGLLTLLAIILFSIITYIVLSDYRDTTKPVVSVNKIKMKAPLPINFHENGIISAVAAFHLDFLKSEQTKKYFTLRPEIVTTTKDAEGNYVEKVEDYRATISDNLNDPKRKN